MTKRLRHVNSYALYYGMGGEDRLAAYDLVIVDPGGRDAAGVQRLSARGTIALAYVSVLEVPQQPGTPPPAGTLHVAGTPWANGAFANWVLDPRAPATRARLRAQVEKALALGYQGIFLDTIADVEHPGLPPLLGAELLPAAASLVADVARTVAGPLVQNWGMQRLLTLTAPLLDGVCWEAFPYAQIGPNPLMHAGIRHLHQLQESLGLQVLALNEGLPPADARSSAAVDSPRASACRAAERCGFLWYGTTRYIDLPQPHLAE